MDVQEVWATLEQHQGEQFYTAKCLPFCYIICGGELFVDRRSKSITISTVAAALQKIATRQAAGEDHHRPQKGWLLWCQLLIPDVLNLGIIPQPETGKEI